MPTDGSGPSALGGPPPRPGCRRRPCPSALRGGARARRGPAAARGARREPARGQFLGRRRTSDEPCSALPCSVPSSRDWPGLPYERWQATCETLHAHTQVLGKLSAGLAPPEPELQHAALRLTGRGWETQPLPAPDGSGAFVLVLDLHDHDAV